MQQLSLYEKIKLENEIDTFFSKEMAFYTANYPNHPTLQKKISSIQTSINNSSLTEHVKIKAKLDEPFIIDYVSVYKKLSETPTLFSVQLSLSNHIQYDRTIIPLHQEKTALRNEMYTLKADRTEKPKFTRLFIVLIVLIIEIMIYQSGGILRTLMGLVLLPTVLYAGIVLIKSISLLPTLNKLNKKEARLIQIKKQLMSITKRIQKEEAQFIR